MFLIYCHWCFSQTVDANYLNPINESDEYKFIGFGNSSEYISGFMWNKTNARWGDGDDFSIYTTENRDMTFKTGTGNFIVFPSDGGNVGIGTKTPDSKLTVNGKIHTKEVKVDLNGWSDFVFEESYNLPTLEEVEKHIKEKGHLKDIPSAKEVEKDGIYLGEMDSKLLQKIEELTLYVIQQQKEMERLKRDNAKLKYLEDRIARLEKKLENNKNKELKKQI